LSAGPIGHLSARVIHRWGHDVTVLDSNEKRLTYLNDLSINQTPKISDYLKYSFIIECTGNAESAKIMLKNSATASTMLMLGLPYDKQIIDLEDIVSSDKRIVGAVGSNGKNFTDAIKLAPKLNLGNFDLCLFDFDEWESAWEEHKLKKQLKVKLKIGS
jgi:threonine dehydrogenase-like Zn-dependent dehydrogenase